MPRQPPAPNKAREERLAAALRENLKRRKQAARALAEVGAKKTSKPAPERPNTAQKPG
jgi:hypothetical protein